VLAWVVAVNWRSCSGQGAHLGDHRCPCTPGARRVIVHIIPHALSWEFPPLPSLLLDSCLHDVIFPDFLRGGKGKCFAIVITEW